MKRWVKNSTLKIQKNTLRQQCESVRNEYNTGPCPCHYINDSVPQFTAKQCMGRHFHFFGMTS